VSAVLRFWLSPFWDGGVAQLGERLLCKQEVIGSIPFTSTNLVHGTDPVVEGSGIHGSARSVIRSPGAPGCRLRVC
jgi:hypothetical protein